MTSDDLPYSKIVNIPALLNVFSSTATSYKYLFFLSLLDYLEETHFDQLEIPLESILLEMLANAWFPHTYFKLSFGINDRITQELDRLKIDLNDGNITNIKNSKVQIKSILFKKDFTRNNLLDLVPYRLLSPFFTNELKGLVDAKRNQKIVELAHSQFEKSKPLYIFSDDTKSIIMNPKWMLYFYENQTV